MRIFTVLPNISICNILTSVNFSKKIPTYSTNVCFLETVLQLQPAMRLSQRVYVLVELSFLQNRLDIFVISIPLYPKYLHISPAPIERVEVNHFCCHSVYNSNLCRYN